MKSPNIEYLNSVTKRRLDVAGGLALASLLAPVGLMAGLVSQIDAGALNPIFQQERIGKGLVPFTVYKFRTIPKKQETETVTPVGTYDPRATRVGMFMREVGIDEIPQLTNVFLGSMSLVGMRPLVAQDLDRLEGVAPRIFKRWHSIYEQVRPGLFGPSQIERHRFEVSTDEVWQRAMELDIDYAENASFRNDLRILGSTPVSLLVARLNIERNTDEALALLNRPDTVG